MSLSAEEGSFMASIINVYDNYQAETGLATGWGFGCVVRMPETTVLFDTGGGNRVLLDNMRILGIDPEEIDVVVLSHNHGDHTGGLEGFLAENGDVDVYVPKSFPARMQRRVEKHGARYYPVTSHIRIAKNVYLTGEMGRAIHEQALVLRCACGTVVITGCAHPGIVDMVQRAAEILPGQEICLVMGGFHLSGASHQHLQEIVDAFRSLGVKQTAPSHCSGDLCRELFKNEYGDSFISGGVGRIIELQVK